MDIESLTQGFNFGKPNKNVLLTKKEPAEIIINEESFKGQGKGILFLGRNASIIFQMSISNSDFPSFVETAKAIKTINANRAKLKLTNRDVGINNGTILSSSILLNNLQNDSILSVSWGALREPFCVYGDEDTEVDYISFHLLNGIDFFCNNPLKEEFNGGFVYNSLASLEWNGWKISIKSIRNTGENIKFLERNGGYALTHIGMAKKDDSSSFKIKDFEEIRSGLSFFLTFAIGRTLWPDLCVGYSNTQKVYEDWGAVASPWSDIGTWWHRTSSTRPHSSRLEELFPLFMDKWSDKNWRTTLGEAIHWYLNSNDTSKLMLEPSLILQQAAIERLAFEYAVNDKKLISSEGFKNLRASDKFRLLFSSLGLPLPIPLELKSLLSISKSRKWEDVPQALTEIRNSIVHPDHRQKGKFSEALYEAWCLSLESLELSILGICGYKGQYQSRVKTKQISVPWN